MYEGQKGVKWDLRRSKAIETSKPILLCKYQKVPRPYESLTPALVQNIDVEQKSIRVMDIGLAAKSLKMILVTFKRRRNFVDEDPILHPFAFLILNEACLWKQFCRLNELKHFLLASRFSYHLSVKEQTNIVFHQFRQAIFAYDGSILISSQFLLLAHLRQKMKSVLKVIKINLVYLGFRHMLWWFGLRLEPIFAYDPQIPQHITELSNMVNYDKEKIIMPLLSKCA